MRINLFSGPGSGKCFGLNTLVLMYDGTIKKIQEIVIGDKLMGNDSLPRLVIELSSGEDDLYEIIPYNKNTYIVNSSHILSLKLSEKRNRFTKHPYVNNKIANIPLMEYLQSCKTFKKRFKGYQVGVEFKEKSVKISPYFLGLWLGERSESCSNSILNDLNFYNLIKNKHIPFDYKTNSTKQRLELLAGLIDTDGSKSGSNNYEFTNKNKKLAEDVVYLSRSLGFRTSISNIVKKSQNGTTGNYYRIYIGGDCNKIPVKIKRKKITNCKKIDLISGIKEIKSIGRGKYYGFEVIGNNNLFLLADFTVVHNSTTAAKLFAELKIKGHKVELVQEEIKKWAYIGRKTKSFDQLFIFGQQLHSEDLIFQSGLHSVTDSPLLMQTVYAIKYNFPAYKELIDIALKYEEVNPSINIFLNRGKIPYEIIGRYENYEQALEMDNKIKGMLNHYLKYEIFDTNDFDQILKYVEQSLLTDSNMVKSKHENYKV